VNQPGGRSVIRAGWLALLVPLALVAGAVLPGLAGAADAPKPPTVSAALQKPLKAIQDLLTAKKYSDAVAKLQEARALPVRTPYDNFVISQFSYQAYYATKDYDNAVKAMAESLDSGFIDAADSAKLVRAIAQLNYQLKNYDKAIEYGTRSIKSGGADEEMYTLVGQAYYLNNDYKGTLGFMNSYVDELEKKGSAPKEQSLQIMLSACLKLQDDSCTTNALERLVVHYPKPEYWQNLILSIRKTSRGSDNTTLNIDRLAMEVDALSPGDYADMAQMAFEAGLPGEAQKVLEKGFANKVFPEGREKEREVRLLESVKKLAATDKSQLASLESQTAAAKTGNPDVKLGIAYLTYDMYDKAVAAIQRGIAKGSLKNPDEAQIMLGVAQLRLKNREEAIKAFKGAKADPNLTRLAGLWALRAQQG